MRFKKFTFGVQRVHFEGALHLPKIDPGYSPVHMPIYKNVVIPLRLDPYVKSGYRQVLTLARNQLVPVLL